MDTCLFHYHSEPYAEHSSSSNQTAHGEVYAGRSLEARLTLYHSGPSVEIRQWPAGVKDRALTYIDELRSNASREDAMQPRYRQTMCDGSTR